MSTLGRVGGSSSERQCRAVHLVVPPPPALYDWRHRCAAGPTPRAAADAALAAEIG